MKAFFEWLKVEDSGVILILGMVAFGACGVVATAAVEVAKALAK